MLHNGLSSKISSIKKGINYQKINNVLTNQDVNAWLIRAWVVTDQYNKVVNLLSSVEDSKPKDYPKKTFPEYALIC